MSTTTTLTVEIFLRFQDSTHNCRKSNTGYQITRYLRVLMVFDVFWMFYLRFLRLKPLFVNYPDAPNRVLVGSRKSCTSLHSQPKSTQPSST